MSVYVNIFCLNIFQIVIVFCSQNMSRVRILTLSGNFPLSRKNMHTYKVKDSTSFFNPIFVTSFEVTKFEAVTFKFPSNILLTSLLTTRHFDPLSF